MSSRAASARKKQLQPSGPPASPGTRAAFQAKPNEVVRPANNSSSSAGGFLKQFKPSYKAPAQALPTFDSSNSIWGPTGNREPDNLTRPPPRDDPRYIQPPDSSRVPGNRPALLGPVHEIDVELLSPPSIHSATSSNSSNSGGAFSSSRVSPHPQPLSSQPLNTFSPNRFADPPRPAQSPAGITQSYSSVPSPAHQPTQTSSRLGSLLSRSQNATASSFQAPHVPQGRPFPGGGSAPSTQHQFVNLPPQPRSSSSASTSFPLPPSPSANNLAYASFQSYHDDLGPNSFYPPDTGLAYEQAGPILPQRSLPPSFVHPQVAHEQHQQQLLRSVSSTPSFNDIGVNNLRPMYQQRRADSFDSVSVMSGSSAPSRDSFPTNPPPRMTAGFALSGPGQALDPQAPASFVYPGSRSRAHPNGAPRFRLRGRKKKDKKRQGGQEGPPKKGILSDSASERSWGADNSGLPSPPLSAGEKDLPKERAGSGQAPTSESSSHFIYPGSRSTARPDPENRVKIGGAKNHDRQDSSTSGNSWEEIKGPHTRFLGLASKSKQKKEAERSPSPMVRGTSQDSGPSTSDSTGASKYPTPDDTSSLSGSIGSKEDSNSISGRVFPINHKIGQYPLDPYDSSLLELDLQTYGLLRKLNPSPSFHDYGRSPPVSVLDLGCGQGHWLLDAAIAWKDHGTRCYGVDMVDTTKVLRPTAIKLGVAENIKFVRCNFIKQGLPFADGSFDLVRMSCLTLAVPFEHWKPLLEEVWRVLSVGGRFELVDDGFIFPYAPTSRLTAATATLPPSSNSIKPVKRELYELPVVEDRLWIPRFTLGAFCPLDSFDDLSNLDPWHQHLAASHELESLFEHMLNHKYGLHLHPSEFIDGLLSEVFGHVKDVQNLHLVLAPPDPAAADVGDAGDDLLAHCPGVIATPSTFVPLTPPEIDGLVSKHSRILLSCKTALIEYALEVADANEVDEETIMEALWEYEGFIRQRFTPPSQIQIPEGPSGDPNFDMRSMRESIMTSTTALSSEGLAALQDYQAELSPLFSAPLAPRVNPSEAPSLSSTERRSRAPSYRTRSGSDEELATTKGDEPKAPPYSRLDLCRVRSFNIYEAIKRSNPLH
ncbi:hypothetical protein DL96DRAFT_1701829 [Flagelloscypha sp. PMI_526]|nr:hypothetical protein DL96DRAFT_1701829 [Flagelloscypha sp. PMI_526]